MTQNPKNCSTTSRNGRFRPKTGPQGGTPLVTVTTPHSQPDYPPSHSDYPPSQPDHGGLAQISEALAELGIPEPQGPDENEGAFVIFLASGLKELFSLMAKGELSGKDISVLAIYSAYADWRTGRCRLTVEGLGQILGHKKATLYPSLRRLKARQLLVPARDPRTKERYFIVNPYLLRAGSGRARGFLIKSFNEAIQKNLPDTPDDLTPDGEL